ncbi:MAG TPA: tetratricopeptide repeat protein [Candidatus Polarisedimenticolaceae bacterium]
MSRPAILAALLSLLTLGVYAGVARNGFVDYDDPAYITQNAHVRGGLTLDTVAWAFTSGEESNWHPLTWLSHALDVTFFGVDPSGHHLVSAGIHALNAALLLLVLHALTGTVWRSAFVAALFALHPLHVESVAWASERKDVLSTLFGLLTVLAYLRRVASPTTAGRVLVASLFALSLLAKPMLVTLPFVLLLLDAGPLKRWNLAEKAPLFALAAASSLVTWLVQRAGGAVSDLDALPFAARAANAAVAYVTYPLRMCWPVDLGVLYPLPASIPAWKIVGAPAVLAAATIAAWRARRRAPYVLLGWLFYLGTLVPVIGLVQVGVQSSADRYTYVPLIGIFSILAWGAHDLLGARPLPKAALAATALLACTALTIRQIGFWRDSTTLFERTLAVTTDNAVVHNNLGGVRMREGRVEAAVAHFEAARRIHPEYAAALSNLGVASASRGKLGEAIALFREALKHRPGHLEAWLNLGDALQKDGDRAGAIAAFRQAQRLKPGDATIASIVQALERLPSTASPAQASEARPHFDRGNALRGAGRYAQAEAAYREAIRLDPRFDAAHNNLGILLAMGGKAEEAAGEFLAVLRLNPRDAGAHLNLGVLLAKQGRGSEAAGHFEEALRLEPENEAARRALARVRR